jgi:glyoxylase-like metal-dependent hydrolase (beta-lactamase superfamily II)
MGDLVLVSGLQFHDPDLGSSFDSDPKAAAEQRRRILALAAARGYWIAGSHLPFPGIGQVRPAANGFAFSPAGGNSVLAAPR